MPEARINSHVIAAGTKTALYMAGVTPVEGYPIQADQGLIPWAINDMKSKPPKVKRISELDDRSKRADGKVEFSWWFDYLTRGMASVIFNTILNLTVNIPGQWEPSAGFNYVVSSPVTVSCPAVTAYYNLGAYHNKAALFTGTVWIPEFTQPELGGWRDVELQFVECTYLADWTGTA